MRLLVGFLVLAVGCKGDEDKVGHLPDAPPMVDADIDASTFGPVTLTILQGAAPRVGIRVLFQAADSSVVSDTTTGTDGKATAMMMPGGFVTAIDPYPGGVQTGVSTIGDVRTFAGVKPGDQLRLFERPIVESTITVDFVLPSDASASEYRISTNCLFDVTGAPGTTQVQLTGCGPTSNLLVQTLDANFAPQKQIYKQSVALVDGGTVDLTADAYAAIPDVTYNYTNVPDGYASSSIDIARITSLGKIYTTNTSASITAGAGTVTLKIPTITGATAGTGTTFYSNGFTQQLVSAWGPVATTFDIDAAGTFLPEFDAGATLDIPNHAVKWTQMGGSVQPDFVYVRARLNRPSPSASWIWEIVAPGGTQAAFPVLPDGHMYNVASGDFGSFDVRTGHIPAGGYDAVRAAMLAFESFHDLAVGASGKASFAFLVEPGA